MPGSDREILDVLLDFRVFAAKKFEETTTKIEMRAGLIASSGA